MKNIKLFFEDKFDEYEQKCAKHIIDTLKNYVDFEGEPDDIDDNWDSWVRFKSTIKKEDLRKIDTELCKVLGDHEVTGNECLYINVLKKPMGSITQLNKQSNEYVVYLKGKTKSYYEKNIKK